ncbi:hypothetical protein SAMN04487989_103118 [Bizionia echini]|uniref:Glutaminyl-tRNA synthetase n=1 Tax=Bizionia echini TaxID=649333 RepID=A0A1I5BG63_9FLAO|nr:DUF6327 family protein [Bizionia echini]SFN73748.1 hypothetical protein SAMN04487989_103118 [Bizionia echini]
MRNYQSFTEIESDLKRLDLERKIALEEMKLLKTEFKEDLKPSNWISTLMNVAGKYGLYVLMKKIWK